MIVRTKLSGLWLRGGVHLACITASCYTWPGEIMGALWIVIGTDDVLGFIRYVHFFWKEGFLLEEVAQVEIRGMCYIDWWIWSI